MVSGSFIKPPGPYFLSHSVGLQPAAARISPTPTPGARRFWGGAPPIAPLAAATAGADILGRAGVRAIDAHNQALIARLLVRPPASMRPSASYRASVSVTGA